MFGFTLKRGTSVSVCCTAYHLKKRDTVEPMQL